MRVEKMTQILSSEKSEQIARAVCDAAKGLAPIDLPTVTIKLSLAAYEPFKGETVITGTEVMSLEIAR